jgi:hypothetical protein
MGERDSMVCRACGREERASEGYPCQSCGTFICQICALRGVVLCAKCAADQEEGAGKGSAPLDTPPPA